MSPQASDDFHALGGIARLFLCRDPEVLIDGPSGTGKTRGVLEYSQYLADEYPGARGLWVRKTRASMTESVLQIFEQWVLVPNEIDTNASRSVRQSYRYRNGSEIVCGGLDNVDRLMSTEYDFAVLFEATEATENDWEKITTRLRHGVVPWQQGIAECNPSYPSHWLKKRADAGKMRRILSRHEDNPTVTPQYLERLRALSGTRRARLYEGRWVAAEGQVYDTFNEAVHVRVRSEKWRRAIIGVDDGYTNPASVSLYLLDGDSRIHKQCEWYKTHKLALDIRGQVKLYCREARKRYRVEVEAVIVDPSAAKLIAELGQAGFPVVSADNDVDAGIKTVHELLQVQGDGQPRLTVDPGCVNTVAEFGAYLWATNHDGSAKDKPVKEHDHALDELRYVARYVATKGSTDMGVYLL